jgi:hypothetical protein
MVKMNVSKLADELGQSHPQKIYIHPSIRILPAYENGTLRIPACGRAIGLRSLISDRTSRAPAAETTADTEDAALSGA